MLPIIRIILLSLLLTGCMTLDTVDTKFYTAQDIELLKEELRKGKMIDVTTLDGKNIKTKFEKFDESTNELHGWEWGEFAGKTKEFVKIPLEDIIEIKVVTKDVPKGVSPIACLLTWGEACPGSGF